MTPAVPPGGAINASLERMTRSWGRGWRRVFPGLWLIYLGQTVDGVSRHSHGAAAVLGYAVVVAFAVTYLTALPMGWIGRRRAFWWLYALAVALTVAELPLARADALVFSVYVAVLTVAARQRASGVVVLGLAAVSAILPRLVWGAPIQYSTALSVLLVSLAMFGFFSIVQANIALAAARAEVARLAAENERSRIARDLHDLLGHSLTTITVKAGLARRLAEHGDTGRAYAEIREVEELSRRTLGDVRAAVSAQRDTNLAGELATAAEVLRAAGIAGELPPTVAETDPAVSELFGWVVREGVTNVVRHARAAHVRIALGRRFVEIADDGRGGTARPGNGLCGLRERVEAAGGTLRADGSGSSGFRLRVDVPEIADGADGAGPAPVAVPR